MPEPVEFGFVDDKVTKRESKRDQENPEASLKGKKKKNNYLNSREVLQSFEEVD